MSTKPTLKLKRWSQVYPQGTRDGDDEQKFFIGLDRQSGLARHPKFEWRSTAAIVKESGLTKERVEQIVKKYVGLGLVIPSPTKTDHWGYWERDEVTEAIQKGQTKGPVDKVDKNARIDAAGN